VSKPKAYLFGPFFGEVGWEYFRFAPYIIHLKKMEPKIQTVVMTRPERFDFYGQYADTLVPLNIINDDSYKQEGFKMLKFDIPLAEQVCDVFRISYKKKYKIIETFVPDFSSFRYRIKWQFPRNKMDYSFAPRKLNIKFINNMIKGKEVIVVDEGYSYETEKYDVVKIEDLKKKIKSTSQDMKITYYGCLIRLLRKSNFVISNLKSDVGKLAILLKTTLIYPSRDLTTDQTFLLNPLKTPIIDCKNIIEGVDIYENNL
jgi:hypothetical protein